MSARARAVVAASFAASCAGAYALATATTLLGLYVGAQLLGLGASALVAYARDDAEARDAATKQASASAVACAALLFGASWIYGLLHATDLHALGERAIAATREQGHVPNALAIGVACVVAGLGFEAWAAPFALARVDVVARTPAWVASFLLVAPPAAGLAALARFFREGLGAEASSATWPVVVGCLGLATSAHAGLSALGERRARRFVVHVGVAQIGAMIVALAAPGHETEWAVTLAFAAYAVGVVGALAVVGASERDAPSGELRIEDVKSPLFAVFAGSLAGLPPLAGFLGAARLVVPLASAAGEYRPWWVFLALAAWTGPLLACAAWARAVAPLAGRPREREP